MKRLAKILMGGAIHDQPYNNCSLWTKVRYKLIKLIAGGDVVILNVSIEVVESNGDRYPVETKGDIDGFLLSDTCLDPGGCSTIVISQYSKEVEQ